MIEEEMRWHMLWCVVIWLYNTAMTWHVRLMVTAGL
jgi:hypothetical protein